MENKKNNTGFYSEAVPEGWEYGAMSNIIREIIAGVSVNGEEREMKSDEYGVLKVSAVSYGFFNHKEYKVINKNEVSRAKVQPEMGSIIMSRANTPELVGANVLITQNFTKLFLSDKLWKINVKSEKFDIIWFSQLLKLNSIKKSISGNATGSSKSMRNISQESLRSIFVPLPPLPEQRAIAACLSTWDAAIQKTTQQITQKEQRKKWLMQQLLTGKRRLKGFGGVWKEYHIRDIAEEVSIRNKANKDCVVLSCTKYNGLVPSLEYFGKRIFSEDTSTYKIVPKDHFAYATNHIEEGSIGYQSNYEEALISPMYTVFKTSKTVNDYYFFKLLKSHQLIYSYNTRMEGSIDRRGGLRWEAFSIIKVQLPTIEEQNAIIQVLQTADQEIQLLKIKVEKMKEQKKGMMQVLLTGKKRLNF